MCPQTAVEGSGGGDAEFEVIFLCRLQEVNRNWSESPFIADNVGALSAEARDLLDKIFVVDPTKRITIHEIMEHPWSALNLYLSPSTCFCTLHSFS